MKTRLLIVLFIAGTLGSFAQKKELRAVNKALKGGNYSEAASLLNGMEGLLGQASDEQKSTYYLYKAQAMFQDGGVTSSDDMLAAAQAVKESLKYNESNDEAGVLANSIRTAVVNSAVADQDKKDYEMAAAKLEAMYRVNPQDTSFLYFAATNMVSAQNYDKALEYYRELKDLGHTGIVERYVAIDAETGEEKEFGSASERDLFVKSGDYINPKTVKSESRATEITKNIALILVSQGKNEEAIAAMKAARALAPDDIGLIQSEADVNYRAGNIERFKELMNEILERDPNNPVTLFNLGVAYKTTGDTEKAKEFYLMALEKDPEYTNANLNMSQLVLDREGPVVDEMNSLGTSNADYARYDELKEVRQGIYREAIPYLEAANATMAKDPEKDGDRVEIVRTLMNIYSLLGEDGKFKAMKDELAKLGG